MIYLDHSATTPVDSRVIDSFNKVTLDYSGNANSIHTLGMRSHDLMEKATKQIADLLGVKDTEVIFTSGATESNNLALKGIAMRYNKRGKHIITTKLEHASISEVVKYLAKEGYEISFVELDRNGVVDLDNLKKLIRKNTILVSICAINSEVGIRQPIEEIGKMLKEYPDTYFHVDATQAIGKIPISFDDVDLASFTAHKIYGIKGIGCLIKKEDVGLVPMFHGGQSQSVYRAGTPALPLIVSLAKALRLILGSISDNYKAVAIKNKLLREEFKKYDRITINSNDKCIPHVLNVSLLDIKPETFVNALSKDDVYISTKTACSSKDELSKTLLAMGKSRDEVLTSIRISLSHLITDQEILEFLEIFKKNYDSLIK